MTTLPRKAIEAGARAIAELRGAIWTPNKPTSANFDHDAATACLTAALAAEGMVMVDAGDLKAVVEIAGRNEASPEIQRIRSLLVPPQEVT